MFQSGSVRVGADRRQRRQRLEAELAHEARVLVAVRGERLAAVPDIPVVRVALNLAVGSLERGIRRRRARPVGVVRVFGRAPRRQRVVEEAVISGLQILVLRPFPAPIHPAPFHLVVAAPERQAGAVAQAPDVLHRLDADVLQELRVVQRVDAARVDELLPDQDPVAVAQIVEALLLVETAAPDAQHVLVRLGRRADQALQGLVGDPGGEGVGRDPVRALGEDRHAVDHKDERAPPCVRLLPQLNRAQADLVRG